MKEYDIIFCALPYSNLDHIYGAPAILKGIVKEHGYTAKTIDFGLELLLLCNNDKLLFDQVQTYFISPEPLETFEHRNIIEKFYDNCINWFKQNPSKFIGISVLSVYTHRSTFELLSRIKNSKITAKIVIGGRGVKSSLFSNVHGAVPIKEIEKVLTYGDFLAKKKLTDFSVIGDGEDAILEILKNNQLQNIENISDSFKYPVPDYEDYKFSGYLTGDQMMLPVTGSKGCVRDCDFCDVKFQFGKYRYRSGADIAKELIALNEKYGVTKFQFTDSLVNGGLKPFIEFITILADYNKNHNKKITWNGQYICRPSNQIPNHMYTLMKESGAEGITIGAESGSNDVLNAMNKKTTVEALYEELEQFRINGITCVLLTFTGHWSETWENFIEHCQMFIKISPYVRSGTISAVAIGHPMTMLDGTPALYHGEMNNIIFSDTNKSQIWYNKSNSENTFKERIYRRLIVSKLCEKLKIPTVNDAEVFYYLSNIIEMQYNEINEFFKDVSD